MLVKIARFDLLAGKLFLHVNAAGSLKKLAEGRKDPG